MAFYSTHLDKTGREIDRRITARRSITPAPERTCCGTDFPTSRSCIQNCDDKYDNAAVYFEKTTDGSQHSSDIDSRTFSNFSDDESNIVPPLDLQSEDSFKTTQRMFPNYLYQSPMGPTKLLLKPDLAYETWLSAKKKLLSDKVSERKKAEEQKREELEARKRMADAKFQQWLESKSRRPTCSREKLKSATVSIRKSSKSLLTDKECKEKLDKWERTKRLEIERRRRKKQWEEERRNEMKKQRREMAAVAWEQWLRTAPSKPKPVPLNRGVFTLRGTISDIFVNPNEWVHISPTIED